MEHGSAAPRHGPIFGGTGDQKKEGGKEKERWKKERIRKKGGEGGLFGKCFFNRDEEGKSVRKRGGGVKILQKSVRSYLNAP